MATVIKSDGTRMVPVNCLIDAELKDEAKAKGINLTKTLRDGLQKEIEKAQAGHSFHTNPARAAIDAPHGNSSLSATGRTK